MYKHFRFFSNFSSLLNIILLYCRNAESVDKVKNLIVFSGKPIHTDKPLGPQRPDHDNNDEFRTPNGLLLDMHKALDLALKMQPNKSYVRIFNSDFKTKVFRNRGSQSVYFNTDPFLLESNYKEDNILEIPSGTNDLRFHTFNKSCVYSWGYQIWKGSTGSPPYHTVPYNNVRGIAGKNLPVGFAGNQGIPVYNSILSSSNTNINGSSFTNSNGASYHEYPNAYIWGFW